MNAADHAQRMISTRTPSRPAQLPRGSDGCARSGSVGVGAVSRAVKSCLHQHARPSCPAGGSGVPRLRFAAWLLRQRHVDEKGAPACAASGIVFDTARGPFALVAWGAPAWREPLAPEAPRACQHRQAAADVRFGGWCTGAAQGGTWGTRTPARGSVARPAGTCRLRGSHDVRFATAGRGRR